MRYVHRAAIGTRDEALTAEEAVAAAQAVIDAEAAARARVRERVCPLPLLLYGCSILFVQNHDVMQQAEHLQAWRATHG